MNIFTKAFYGSSLENVSDKINDYAKEYGYTIKQVCHAVNPSVTQAYSCIVIFEK